MHLTKWSVWPKATLIDMEEILKELERIEGEALKDIERAGDERALEEVKVRYLGRKGRVTACLRQIGQLPKDIRAKVGKRANEAKERIQGEIFKKSKKFSERAAIKKERIDITLPGRRPYPYGTLHPITQCLKEICDIFLRMGFGLVEGPDVELDYYNFEALNIPPYHPARDMQDTFYVSENVVLRTHTSSIQVRVMERLRPPIKVISAGAVYRCDADISHTPMFHQVEGLLVERGISFAHLKGILTFFMQQMFGSDVKVRFRPSYFPFTEPSAEMDIMCVICKGRGCRICGHTGWLEILGCGMVHPEVFKRVNYDPEVYTGLAFGMGVERIAMLKYGIDDIRLFFENHLRFLRQF